MVFVCFLSLLSAPITLINISEALLIESFDQDYVLIISLVQRRKLRPSCLLWHLELIDALNLRNELHSAGMTLSSVLAELPEISESG